MKFTFLCVTTIALIFLFDPTFVDAKKMMGVEYGARDKAVEGDVDHDGLPILSVLYTNDGEVGGNGHSNYLAVFGHDAKQGVKPSSNKGAA